ncbi:MAG: zf-TFIIB domain-containing protein [Spirochaetes bacterium]|nr:zf-TFIIB domain-containing protein [Spirochaetota bacterium]
MNCQICKNTITPTKAQGIEIYSCNGCKGFWIKKGELNKLIEHTAGDLEQSSIDHHFHKDTHGTLKCIYCDDSAMIKINFIEFSDIILDYCEQCGCFWIDSDEVEKMQQYVKKIEKNDKPSRSEIIMSIFYSLPQI